MQTTQTTRNAPRKAPKFLDVKILIASLSVAVTVGFWNLFSSTALQPESVSPETDTSLTVPPMPTLAPLVQVEIPEISVQTVTNAQPAGQTAPAATQLRAVTAPTAVVVQKVKPVIDQPVLVESGGGSGKGSGSSSPAPVTSTKSSR